MVVLRTYEKPKYRMTKIRDNYTRRSTKSTNIATPQVWPAYTYNKLVKCEVNSLHIQYFKGIDNMNYKLYMLMPYDKRNTNTNNRHH